MKALVEDMLGDYVEIKFGSTPLLVGSSVEMTVYVCPEEEKESKLADLLNATSSEKRQTEPWCSPTLSGRLRRSP